MGISSIVEMYLNRFIICKVQISRLTIIAVSAHSVPKSIFSNFNLRIFNHIVTSIVISEIQTKMINRDFMKRTKNNQLLTFRVINKTRKLIGKVIEFH